MTTRETFDVHRLSRQNGPTNDEGEHIYCILDRELEADGEKAIAAAA